MAAGPGTALATDSLHALEAAMPRHSRRVSARWATASPPSYRPFCRRRESRRTVRCAGAARLARSGLADRRRTGAKAHGPGQVDTTVHSGELSGACSRTPQSRGHVMVVGPPGGHGHNPYDTARPDSPRPPNIYLISGLPRTG